MAAPYTNHLINEKSPYLQQHAHNPVDWYPWSEEAFALAQSQDKPIFLSIGYATCHWCHVMEKESFESLEIAKRMNEVFVNIKVDREELPEVDSTYMEFAQALMSSSGGWPLNVILTPDLKPFFAVTYLPPSTKRGLMGLEQFIEHIKQLWESEERSQLIEQADKVVDIFQRASQSVGDALPSEDMVDDAAEVMFEAADPVYGGMKGDPKFPMGYQAIFLLQYSRLNNDSRSLFFVELTLDMMCRGGIYDTLGGGFSRYSVDERWYIPHFEKMLYDNAILAKTYLEAWKFIKKPSYKQVCIGTLEYVLRDMTSPEGGFYSAEDADSEGHEGLFYTWTPSEVKEVLSPEDADFFCRLYGVTDHGNFEGRSVLHLEHPLEDFSEALSIPVDQIEKKLQSIKEALLKKRSSRKRPFKDDKVLSAWNGLMIDAMIKASSAFQKEEFAQAALKAAQFIKSKLWVEGNLLRRYREGESRFSAGLDEYAFMIKGVLSLFEEGQGSEWLQWAMEMAANLERDFKAPNGAFYQTDGQTQVLIRKCEFYDGSEPSGNGVHCENLLRLYQITLDKKYLSQSEDILKAARHFIDTYPPGACYHLIALQRYYDQKAANVVIALDANRSLEKEIFNQLGSHFSPHTETIWKRKEDERLLALIPSLKDKDLIKGKTAVYICRQDVCEPPLSTKEEIMKAVDIL